MTLMTGCLGRHAVMALSANFGHSGIPEKADIRVSVNMNFSNETRRKLIGFTVAPLVPALLLCLLSVVNGYGNASVVPLVLLPFAYAAALIVGIPVHLVMQRKGVQSLWGYLICGAAIGMTFEMLMDGLPVLLNWSSERDYSLALIRSSVGSLIVAIGYAVVASGVFWLMALWKPSHVR
jgi:hypothetical protein